MSVFHVPSGGGVAAPVGELTVDAKDQDALLATARLLLGRTYPRVRSVSFTPSGLVAYVEGEVRS